MKARELGFDVTNATPQLRDMLARIKELEHQGYEFEAADGSLALLIRRALTDDAAAVHRSTPITCRCAARATASVCEATVKVRVGERIARTRVAEGDGPVNALDAALRAALVSVLSGSSQTVRLTDYKVRIIDSTSGTAATTRVLIESSDGTAEWGTVGVNDNIVEASLQALVDSLECPLIQKSASGRPASLYSPAYQSPTHAILVGCSPSTRLGGLRNTASMHAMLLTASSSGTARPALSRIACENRSP